MATTSTSTVNSSSPPSSSDATSTPSLSSSSTESPLPLSSSTPSPPTTTLATNYAGINASLLLPVESRGGGGGLDNAEEAVGNGLGTARGKPAAFNMRKLARPTATPTVLQAASTPVPSTPTPSTPAAPPETASAPPPFPALHLTPLNDTFVPKQIALGNPGTRIKIGRQTNAKTIPNATNGYFDSKVLSRMHAEVWSEDSKVFIKDVKSSNGTFINGERLSPEAAESDIFELHTDDVVEFGIDIVSDDNKTIVHHKVATKVYLVMNAEDAIASSREFNTWYRNAGEAPMHRRVKPANAGNGLSFEHILNRLQGEIQKSRDTGTNLGDLTSTLSVVQDTLGGGAPPPLPPFTTTSHNPLSRVQPPMNGKDPHAISISVLQSQLSETQSNLSGYAGKIRELEGKVEEHKGVKVEVGLLRERMEETERDLERLGKGGSAQGRGGRESPVAALLEREEEEEDDDDAASVASMDTVMDNNVVGRKGRARSASMREMDKAEEEERRTADLARERHLVEQNQRLAERLEALSVELDEATKLGQTLRAQHADAATTIKTLEACVVGLEKAVEGRVKEVEGRVSAEAERWMGWRVEFEMGWKKERESWEVEREKLMRVVRDWEERRSEESEASDESEAETVEMSRELSGSTVESKSPRGKKGKGKKKKKGNKGVKVVEGNTKVDISARVNGTTSAAEAVVVDGGSSAIKSKSSTAAVDDDSGSRNTSLSTPMLPYASAGAIVLLSVAAAWALSLKLKE